jgi:hypothetical protein
MSGNGAKVVTINDLWAGSQIRGGLYATMSTTKITRLI